MAGQQAPSFVVTGANVALGGPPLRKWVTARAFNAVQVLDSEAKSLVAKVTPVVCEMNEAKDIDHLSELIRDRFGRLDRLFGHAGIPGRKHQSHRQFQIAASSQKT